MKILHTSDWHLGQKLLQNDRHNEFEMALDWLLQTIEQEKVDVLLVAGDVFDIGNPPNQARQLYYDFLGKLMRSSCRHIVITGGNHDSPSMLNAPKALLASLNVHVVGAFSGDLEDELIVLKDKNNTPELVVAAVPFLRDRDLRVSMAGETQQDRNNRLQAGLTQHYEDLAQLASKYKKANIPFVAMGHLYAKNAVAADKQDNIYLGNRENIEASQFPALFNYVALGHIHRAQIVGGEEHIRYSGSLIPLSFSERGDVKGVYLLETKQKDISSIKSIKTPVFRRLKSITGDLEKVQKALERFAATNDSHLTAWVEVSVETDTYIPQLDELLRSFTENMNLELVKIRINRPYLSLSNEKAVMPDLEDLAIDDVFKKRCESYGDITDDQLNNLMETFSELKVWMNEKEEAK